MSVQDYPPPFPPPPPAPKSNKTVWWVVGIIGGCLVLTCCAALIVVVVLFASGKINLPFLGGLNPNAAPTSGQTSLSVGFSDDPYSTTVGAGGTVDASTLDLAGAGGCIGYYNPAPSFSLNWTGNSNSLRFFSIGNGQADTTMIVHAPDGTYYCNDDAQGGGYDPMISLPYATTGQYDIWVGTYSSSANTTVTLYVTEMDHTPTTLFGGGGDTLDLGGTPFYGETSLNSGFAPDPFQVAITSGGSVDVGMDVGMGCNGYAASSPDFRLHWSGSSSNLRIFFVASGGEDTTLIVNDARGGWNCNDDASTGGRDPMVDIANPPAGTYDIWVGSYSSGTFASGTLYITEMNRTPQDYGSTGTSTSGLDYTLTSTYGSQEIGSAGNPSTFQLTMLAGGSLDVSAQSLGLGCTGYAAAAPDIEINYQGTASRIRVFFIADDGSDTTLIINTSSANWACNDDSGPGSIDPMVEILNPGSGVYDIWVGTLSNGGFVDGTLYVTEEDYQPGHLPF